MLQYLHNHGMPGWFSYYFIEASANVALFIPFGLLIAMARPVTAWWRLASIGLMISTCLELAQHLFLAARFASLIDVVTNMLGAVIGILLARLVTGRKLTELRSPRS